MPAAAVVVVVVVVVVVAGRPAVAVPVPVAAGEPAEAGFADEPALPVVVVVVVVVVVAAPPAVACEADSEPSSLPLEQAQSSENAATFKQPTSCDFFGARRRTDNIDIGTLSQ